MLSRPFLGVTREYLYTEANRHLPAATGRTQPLRSPLHEVT